GGAAIIEEAVVRRAEGLPRLQEVPDALVVRIAVFRGRGRGLPLAAILLELLQDVFVAVFVDEQAIHLDRLRRIADLLVGVRRVDRRFGRRLVRRRREQRRLVHTGGGRVELVHLGRGLAVFLRLLRGIERRARLLEGCLLQRRVDEVVLVRL